jgi:murein L,D-transpeptidase YcbB/YkuD
MDCPDKTRDSAARGVARWCRVFVLTIIVFAGGGAASESLGANSSSIEDALRHYLEAGTVDRKLAHPAELADFYRARAYAAIWVDQAGPGARAAALRRRLQDAVKEGLDPLDYHAPGIGLHWDERSPDGLAALELILSDALARYGSDLRVGRIDPHALDSEFFLEPREIDRVALLSQSATATDFEAFLDALAPPHADYRALRGALAAHRRIAAHDGWPRVPDGPSLRLGSRDSRVHAIRERLTRSGDLMGMSHEESAYFGERVEAAVRRFQMRHGLEIDGIVGPKTLAALNISVDGRIRQIELNMERWRWMPDDLGRRHARVNVAGFELEVIEDQRVILSMRAVVGRPYRRTPIFTSEITDITVNPYWHVPSRIAVKDLLPKIQTDPTYLANQGIRIFGHDGEVQGTSVDWARCRPGNFPYTLRQDPGDLNALGRLRFNIPNPFVVYLHGTPSRDLFLRSQRTFSSGCIRLEKTRELALYLLRGVPEWDEEALVASIDSGETTHIPLAQPLRTHILYMTAWVDHGGRFQFRSDVYGLDDRLLKALAKRRGLGVWPS